MSDLKDFHRDMFNVTQSYNTRIAPSPTGDMHMGTARTAYFNWLIAKSTGGSFYLRIDDTDLDRNDDSKTKDILTVMDWLDLDYDDVYYQSKRADIYNAIADEAVRAGWAVKEDGCIRLDNPDFTGLSRVWVDQISGSIEVSDQDLEYISSMVLIKSNGTPTYNFANVVDDHLMKINYVIRGIDHQKNTSKQFMLLQKLGYKAPKYAHLGLLFKNKKKLSKRDGAASMISYMEQGYDSEAMLNFLLRLGWGPKVDDKTTRILTRERALALFLHGGNMRGSPANIDLVKLASFDRKYKGRRMMKTLE
jgi:glutamyl-tRNA synthetase